MRRLGRTLVTAAREFMDDEAPRLASSLSYYTIFSLPPFLVALIGVAGIAFGEDEVRERLMTQLGELVGSEPARMLGDAVRDAEQTGSGLTVVVGTAMLLIGAGGTFGQLQSALNTVWDVAPVEGGGVMRFVQARFLSFAAVLGQAFSYLFLWRPAQPSQRWSRGSRASMQSPRSLLPWTWPHRSWCSS